MQYGQPVTLWDPVEAQADGGGPGAGMTTLLPKGAPAGHELSLSHISRPQWSRDGTRVAFTGSAPDPGDPLRDGSSLEQTSIWVYTVETGALARLTHPPAGMTDTADDALDLGHHASDSAPTWSPDGSTIAFIRTVRAGLDDEWHAHDGVEVWTVPSAGGAAGRLTDQSPDNQRELNSLAWAGADTILAGAFDELVRVSTTTGGVTAFPGTEGLGVQQPDVAPDGTRFTYVEMDVETATLTAHVLPTGGGDAIASVPATTQSVYSPTGDGLLSSGCVGPGAVGCGVIETYVPEDPGERDTRPGETKRLALGMFPGGLFDVQPQELPVLFLPGFLGSVIECEGDNLWPGEFLTIPEPLEMLLGPDGVTNAGCPGTRATGEAVGSVAFQDVYEPVMDFMAGNFGERGHVLGWDWRKRPHETLATLDEKIDDLLAAPGLGKRQGVGRVVLWGHSYGGLLIRSYLQRHPAKVARALTVGTPYWGSPKAIFPLAFGIETPIEAPGLDLFFANSSLKQLAANLGGLYQLFPSARFPPWLSVNGVPAATAQVVGDLGGNAGLLAQAQGYHDADYEGFYDNGGRTEVRAVAGTGVATVGAVDLRPRDGAPDGVGIGWVDGDGTVPAISAGQGPVGGTDPFGDDVHVQHRCQVEHVALANDTAVLEAYDDWLRDGSVPDRLPPPCAFRAGKLEFEPGDIGPEPQERRSSRAAAGTLNLADADAADLAQVLAFEDRVMVVTDDERPFTLRLPLDDATFTYTPLTAAGSGATRHYGPVTGLVEIATATVPGGLPSVTAGGATVVPHPVAAAPGGGATSDGGGNNAGAGLTPSSLTAGVPAPPFGPTVTNLAPVPARPTVRPLRVLGRPTLRGRTLTARVALPAPGVLRATVRRAGRTLATGRKTIKRKGSAVVRLSLRRRPSGPVRLALAFKPLRGPAALATLTVRPRR